LVGSTNASAVSTKNEDSGEWLATRLSTEDAKVHSEGKAETPRPETTPSPSTPVTPNIAPTSTSSLKASGDRSNPGSRGGKKGKVVNFSNVLQERIFEVEEND
jgi:hypothetical protein